MRAQKLMRSSDLVGCGSLVSAGEEDERAARICSSVIFHFVFGLVSLSANRVAYCHGPESLSILNPTPLA